MPNKRSNKDLCRVQGPEKERRLALYGECHVDNCDQPKKKGNRFLCVYHHRHGENDAPEIRGGKGLTGRNINMEKVLASIKMPCAVLLSSEDFTQFELKYYLEHGELPTLTERMAI